MKNFLKSIIQIVAFSIKDDNSLRVHVEKKIESKSVFGEKTSKNRKKKKTLKIEKLKMDALNSEREKQELSLQKILIEMN